MIDCAGIDCSWIDRAWIAARIPHQDPMCLLDGVVAWDAQQIHCRASSHRDAANPLRHAEQLSAVCGIEYAAQAMAVHGALLAESVACDSDERKKPRAGFLASVRSVNCHVERLDDQQMPLEIRAQCISGNGGSMLYTFSISAADTCLLDGRAAVILDADAHPSLQAGESE